MTAEQKVKNKGKGKQRKKGTIKKEGERRERTSVKVVTAIIE